MIVLFASVVVSGSFCSLSAAQANQNVGHLLCMDLMQHNADVWAALLTLGLGHCLNRAAVDMFPALNQSCSSSSAPTRVS